MTVAELKRWVDKEMKRHKVEALKSEARHSLADARAGRLTVRTRPSRIAARPERTVAELGGLERIPGRIASRITVREMARALMERHRLVTSGSGPKRVDDQLAAWGLRWRPPSRSEA